MLVSFEIHIRHSNQNIPVFLVWINRFIYLRAGMDANLYSDGNLPEISERFDHSAFYSSGDLIDEQSLLKELQHCNCCRNRLSLCSSPGSTFCRLGSSKNRDQKQIPINELNQPRRTIERQRELKGHSVSPKAGIQYILETSSCQSSPKLRCVNAK